MMISTQMQPWVDFQDNFWHLLLRAVAQFAGSGEEEDVAYTVSKCDSLKVCGLEDGKEEVLKRTFGNKTHPHAPHFLSNFNCTSLCQQTHVPAGIILARRKAVVSKLTTG